MRDLWNSPSCNCPCWDLRVHFVYDCSVGVGILSTPYAAAKGGWLSLILLLFFALICCYTAILLRRCLDSDPYIRSYRDVGEASFGKWGRWIVSILLYLELYAVTVEFLIMEGDNLAHRFPSASISLGRYILDPHEVFIILSAAIMLPTVWLRKLPFQPHLGSCECMGPTFQPPGSLPPC